MPGTTPKRTPSLAAVALASLTVPSVGATDGQAGDLDAHAFEALELIGASGGGEVGGGERQRGGQRVAGREQSRRWG